jgi:hypothetical protein
MIQAEAPKQYAFPVAYVQQEQALLAKDWPDVRCEGKVKVTMRGGGDGYRFIRCAAELGNPATTWWFYITSDGRVHVRPVVVS